ncbi:hypothetical protein AVEN_120983-1 [Araneus ventricosus]|uniref:Uncharacterized protein n=1 Tax=Araneus ventricosus TaxID=182803 RepID=A0A4Y2LAN6_ARAVE|nr:hypothetical protein AVEN_120983-1 [Araneus ventricosus]
MQHEVHSKQLGADHRPPEVPENYINDPGAPSPNFLTTSASLMYDLSCNEPNKRRIFSGIGSRIRSPPVKVPPSLELIFRPHRPLCESTWNLKNSHNATVFRILNISK